MATAESDRERRKTTDNPIKEMVSHLTWALNIGWESGYGIKTPVERSAIQKSKQDETAKKEQKQKNQQIALDFQKIKTRYEAKFSTELAKLIQKAKSDPKAEQLISDFSKTLNTDWQKNDFAKTQWGSILLRNKVGEFLAKKFNISLPYWDEQKHASAEQVFQSMQ